MGYIKLHRQILEHDLWLDEKFTKGQAWVDLILQANYKDKKALIDSEWVIVKRGTFITSIHKLAERWGWAVNTVKKFLNLLESDEMIHKNSNNRYTLIDIVNYQYFQDKQENPCTPIDTLSDTVLDTVLDTQRAQSLTQSLTPTKEYKEYKESKEGKEIKKGSIYSDVVDLFNSICVSYPKVVALSDKRKSAINARLKKYTLDDIKQVFIMAEESDFLKGDNNRNWAANFDWMLKDTNFPKILEGNYKNKRAKSELDDFYTMAAQWAEERSNGTETVFNDCNGT